jgi:hypothetical protein
MFSALIICTDGEYRLKGEVWWIKFSAAPAATTTTATNATTT